MVGLTDLKDIQNQNSDSRKFSANFRLWSDMPSRGNHIDDTHLFTTHIARHVVYVITLNTLVDLRPHIDPIHIDYTRIAVSNAYAALCGIAVSGSLRSRMSLSNWRIRGLTACGDGLRGGVEHSRGHVVPHGKYSAKIFRGSF